MLELRSASQSGPTRDSRIPEQRKGQDMNFAPKPKQAFAKAAPGIHTACCIGVWDLGCQANTGQFSDRPPQDKVLIAWEVESGEVINKEYPRVIDQWKTRDGILKRSSLKKDLEDWFAPHKIEDPATFDARKLLGQYATLVVGVTAGGNPKVETIARPDPAKTSWTPNRDFMYYEIGDEIPAGTEAWVVSRINSRILPGEGPQSSPEVHSQSQPSSAAPVPF